MNPKVILVSTPFGPLYEPSIALGLLSACLRESQLPSRSLYLTIPFAELIGVEAYTDLACGRPVTYSLLGEWVFASALFPEGVPTLDKFRESVLPQSLSEAHSGREQAFPAAEWANVDAAQQQASTFLDSWAERIAEQAPAVVGFTSVFQQQLASLALARRVKQLVPQALIVFGGANIEGPMGVQVLKSFDFVDAVISGEGEVAFTELCKQVISGGDPATVPGVHLRKPFRQAARVLSLVNLPGDPDHASLLNARGVAELDSLPFPDYDDFFAVFRASKVGSTGEPRLLFETSRGCWWGEKHHCTFCGLNGSTMRFRSKTPERAVEEVTHLTQRYRVRNVSAVDNIMDAQYFRTFLPLLAERGLDVDLFYEVKANLRKRDVQALRAAGITRVQPGVESLSSMVLRMMNKGIKAIQNVQLLKWCKELGVEAYWNILWGFPGEPAAEYKRMTEMVPLLTHLPPPRVATPIRLDRFSPNFDERDARGFANVRPHAAYSQIYQLPEEEVFNLAYFFDFDYRRAQDVASYTSDLGCAIGDWKRDYSACDLFFVDKGDALLVWDFRPAAAQPLIILRGPMRSIYLFCDEIHGVRAVERVLLEKGYSLPGVAVEAMLTELVQARLMLEEDGLHLSLGLPLGEYTPEAEVLQKLSGLATCTGHAMGSNAHVDRPPAVDPAIAILD